MFKKEMPEEDLQELFSNDESCYRFLADIKWEKGYICRKCGNNNYCEGKTPYSRRCTRCKAEESDAAGTIFHNCKFPLHKAFYIAYNVCRGKEELSTYEFARRLSLRQMTCWNFRKKIRDAVSDMEHLSVSERESLRKILD